MKTLLKIAVRNIFRNGRRSLMTISAVAVGAMSMLLFGEFVSYIILGLQTEAVENGGHIAVFREGYFKYGGGNPAAYGIHDYETVLATIKEDAELKPLIAVATPTVNLFGIAGNFDADASKTFFGVGVVPADYERMRKWDEYAMVDRPRPESGLSDEDETRGVVGAGLARVLGLCESLKLTDCPPKAFIATADAGKPAIKDFSALVDKDVSPIESNGTLPRLDLLAGTATGAPNVVSFYVTRASPQGVKEIDDSFVGMHFNLAQQLLYGRGERQAVSLVVQLHRTEDMAGARARIEHIIKDHGWNLEVRDLLELQPFYRQVIGMFGAIFSFIAAIMVVIVLFTVVNTMSMSVMERINEIGTLRALGVRKKGIRLQFLAEGAVLGVAGATIGLMLGAVIAEIVNHSGLTWLPPGQSASVPLRVMTSGNSLLIMGIWLGLGLMATLAAYIPANRAARMQVVEALGHV